jgi:hypothetical protein
MQAGKVGGRAASRAGSKLPTGKLAAYSDSRFHHRAMEPVTYISPPTCEIVTLMLGPLRFELLGMVIDLDSVAFTINGDPMSGFVGRWLCALAEATWPDSLAALLNRLPSVLG